MSKIAHYLNEHILGLISVDARLREVASVDASILKLSPEMVAYPRTTNDVRKIARFSWQLAEKGHVLSITPRGLGGDTTGAAIGGGIVVDMSSHFTQILEIDTKQKLVRVQPGVRCSELNNALYLQGLTIPVSPEKAACATIGGLVANNARGEQSGTFGESAHQLEVVLASGDVIQTERISRRDLNQRKGQQNFEGEIYRNLDDLIDEHADTIEKISRTANGNNAGYPGIAQVRKKDGSFDITPLFAGAQGTLGIVTEMIMKADFLATDQQSIIAFFDDTSAAADAMQHIAKVGPSLVNMYDGQLFVEAAKKGKEFTWYSEASKAIGKPGVVVHIECSEPSERKTLAKIKKLEALLTKEGAAVIIFNEAKNAEAHAIKEVINLAKLPTERGGATPPILNGFFVPASELFEFSAALAILAEKYRYTLPLYGSLLNGIWQVSPVFFPNRVSDKQRMLKMIDDLANLVANHDGYLIAESGEGRLKSNFAYKHLDADVVKLYQKIRTLFDPHGTMNPGVKQKNELRELIGMLRSEYSDNAPLGRS